MIAIVFKFYLNNELCKELNENSNYVKVIEVKYRDFKIIVLQSVRHIHDQFYS